MINPEEIAREVLRAWFKDPNGFKDMTKQSNKDAVVAVEIYLGRKKHLKDVDPSYATENIKAKNELTNSSATVL